MDLQHLTPDETTMLKDALWVISQLGDISGLAATLGREDNDEEEAKAEAVFQSLWLKVWGDQPRAHKHS